MIRKFDFLVIGSGVAGMSYALQAAASGKGKVALVCKTQIEEANTAKAQGGIASVTNLKVDDLDGDTFVQCRKVKTREGGGHPWGLLGDMDLLRSCQLVRSGKDDSCSLTYAALLLFGTVGSV